MEKDYNVAGLPQTLENLEKHFFFSKSLWKPGKNQGHVLKDLTHHGKVRDFSSGIPFNPSSILSLSIRNSR